ncbi:hypothetical protein FQA39_LY12959 [Lamprigera yunnana]|nr:hypothetical protein FQA39_LY12959 [Lamprigera yunnana]
MELLKLKLINYHYMNLQLNNLNQLIKFIILEKTVDLYKDKKKVQNNVPTEYETKFHAQEDDAIGECYDKVARTLGLSYPGGPVIDKLAQTGDSNAYKFPVLKDNGTYNFSYSGIKTAAINLIHNMKQKNEEINLENFAASFQKAVTAIVELKLEKAIKEFKPNTLTVAGGVSANSEIRKIISKLGDKYLIKYHFVPEMQYCTDNGAMIANLAYEKYKTNK